MKADLLEHPIWQGLVNQNRKDQELLYRRYYSYGMSICLRYTSTREEAKEILHDGFMVLFAEPKKFDPYQPFKPWFRKVLVNRCINLFKKQQFLLVETAYETIPETRDPNPSILDSMHYEELLQLIGVLPPAYRAVFNLYVLDGFTHEEISELLGISLGTSKSNLFRAREKLKQLLTHASHAREFIRQEQQGAG